MFPLRDENPSHGSPFVTVVLIIVNLLVFFYQVSLGPAVEQFVYQFATLPIEVTTNRNLEFSQGLPPYLSLLSSMFLHGGWMHLIGNVWFLWVFGDNIEDFLGHVGFLFFYLVTGIAAGLAHVWLNADSAIPTLGASGAISGVLGAYLILHPMIRIRTLVTLGFFWRIMRVPAVFFLGIWFLLQFLGGFQADSGVAYGAHVGGFVAGVVLILIMSRGKRPAVRATYESGRSARWH